MSMNTAATSDPAQEAKPMLNEDDIGSGERSPGQQETDKLIGEVPKLPHDDEEDGDEAGGPSDRS